MTFNPGGTTLGIISDTSPVVQAHFKIIDDISYSKEFYVTSAQLLALFATPVTVLAAPGAGYALILNSATIFKPAGTAYGGIAAGEDLAFRYTDASGTVIGSSETTGFLDQTTAQTRLVYPYRAASGVSDVNPTQNAAIVFHMLTAEITTGTSPLQLRIFYKIVKTDLSHILTTQTQT